MNNFLFMIGFLMGLSYQRGSSSSSLMCLTHSPMMEGVCKPAKSCQSYQGFCENSGNVCCVETYKCGGVTREKVSYFQNEEFPMNSETGTLCSHILKVSEGVCFVKLDFHEFSLQPGPGSDCQTDWFSIIGANGGQQVVASLCGDRRAQSLMVPVHEYQNLILAVGIQTAGKSLWNIQATMIECKHVSLSWKDGVVCDKKSYYQKGGDKSPNLKYNYDGLKEYNTSTGAMILLSNKNNGDFYTWYQERSPRKLQNVKRGLMDSIVDRRDRKRRNKERKRKRDKKKTSYLLELKDDSIPVVKIMSGDEILCPGIMISQYFVLASSHCVQNMTGLYIHNGKNMSIYQVYIYTEFASKPVAIIQTLSQLPYTKICFDKKDKSTEEMLIGFKKHSKRKDVMVYTNVTVNPIRNNFDAVLQNIDLNKMTEGSLIVEASRPASVSVTGIVSKNKSSGSCTSGHNAVTLLSDDILGWISAIITQNTPVISVS